MGLALYGYEVADILMNKFQNLSFLKYEFLDFLRLFFFLFSIISSWEFKGLKKVKLTFLGGGEDKISFKSKLKSGSHFYFILWGE